MGKIEAKLIRELKSTGHNYKGIADIFKHTLPAKVVEVILKWLPEIYEEHLGSGEMLVRSLISAEEPFDPCPLIDIFENSHHNKVIKCTIGYVLAISKTYDISIWIRKQLLDKEPSFERAGLLDGILTKMGVKDRLELMQVLKILFDKYFRFQTFQDLYKKYSNKEEDLIFLEEKIENPELEFYKAFIAEADKYFNDNKAKHAHKQYEREVNKLIERIIKKKKSSIFKGQNALN
jgi:hypothetical protein